MGNITEAKLNYEENLISLEKDLSINGERIIIVAKDNWPLELIKGKPITNFIRKILLTKYKIKYKDWRAKGGCTISFK